MLNEKAMLVKLNISQWTGRKKDLRISKETNSFYGAEQNSGHYTKMLVAKEALKAINKTVNAARSFHYENTLPWGENNERLLPSKNYLDYTEKMREFAHAFDGEVKNFTAEYSTLVLNAQYSLNQMFNQSDYPAESEISHKFNFATDVTPVPSATDFRVSLAQDEVESIKQKLEQQTRTAQAKAMEDLWHRLYDVVEKMSEKLSCEDAIFRDSLVGNVQKLTELLPKLNITDDRELDNLSKQVQQKLCRHSPKKLRSSTQAKKQTAYEADAVLEKMSSYMGQQSLSSKKDTRRAA